MTTETTSSPTQHTDLAAAQSWWAGLTNTWKRAFNEVALGRKNSTEPLPDELLMTVFTCPNHRFAGPEAPYPNMTFELEDLSGLVGLPNPEVVVVTFHRLTHVREVAQIPTLRSLFVFNNQITSLAGVEHCADLIEIYFQSNQVNSLEPLRNLTKLKTVYCAVNLLDSLEGLGPQHADHLENLICQPNEHLKSSTIFAFEQQTHIRCRKG
jgi:Leucine-rich repeat (LRR) protein